VWKPSALVRLYGTPYEQDTIIRLAYKCGYEWTGTEYLWCKWYIDEYP
jgi:hypothetical protein